MKRVHAVPQQRRVSASLAAGHRAGSRGDEFAQRRARFESHAAEPCRLARQVFQVGSYSADDSVDITRRHQVHVGRYFSRGFAGEWTSVLRKLPITVRWTTNLDPVANENIDFE